MTKVYINIRWVLWCTRITMVYGVPFKRKNVMHRVPSLIQIECYWPIILDGLDLKLEISGADCAMYWVIFFPFFFPFFKWNVCHVHHHHSMGPSLRLASTCAAKSSTRLLRKHGSPLRVVFHFSCFSVTNYHYRKCKYHWIAKWKQNCIKSVTLIAKLCFFNCFSDIL